MNKVLEVVLIIFGVIFAFWVLNFVINVWKQQGVYIDETIGNAHEVLNRYEQSKK
jgi:hypothetical protein